VNAKAADTQQTASAKLGLNVWPIMIEVYLLLRKLTQKTPKENSQRKLRHARVAWRR